MSTGTPEPIVGVKMARLVSVGDGLYFAPAFPRPSSAPYRAVAQARCEVDLPHAAPDVQCHCGFYAVGARKDLWRLGPTAGTVVLDVELAGTVIEHRFGWRAGSQAVLGVHLPARCSRFLCRRATTGVAPYRAQSHECRNPAWTVWRPVCAKCAKRRSLGLADVANHIGVEVTIDDAFMPAPVDARQYDGTHVARFMP